MSRRTQNIWVGREIIGLAIFTAALLIYLTYQRSKRTRNE